MADLISRFSIKGLHSAVSVDVPISEGKIILVGVNGLGKTTIVSILYYFLTRQWSRLIDFEFEEVALTIAGEKLSLARSDLFLPDSAWQESLFESMSEGSFDRLKNSPDFHRLVTGYYRHRNPEYHDLINVAKRLDISIGTVERAFIRFTRNSNLKGKKSKRIGDHLEKIEARLEQLAPQVLYLPTYRRIEQDLKFIFPEFEGDFKKVVKQRASRYVENRGGFVELVEFGMEDVDSRVSSRVSALKEGSRLELNNLAGGYLRDVIRGEARQWNGEKITTLDDHEIKLILGRVEEKQLSEDDKEKVFEVINRIRDGQKLSGDQELLAHFFSKLVQIHEAQRTSEVPIRQFIEVCNKYLVSKYFEYDDVNFKLPLKLSGGGEIQMKDLSSGEKQIVSLFAHVYLGNASKFYLIIDEPELSLSVEWQKTLLPDLMASGRCEFLAAVTHSPFIYDNELEQYAMDLAQFQVAYER